MTEQANPADRNCTVINLTLRGRSFVGAIDIKEIGMGFWKNHKMLCLDLGVLDQNIPIKFALEVDKKIPNKINHPSDNNRGRIMPYSSKVPDYKASFLMTKDEEDYYKVNKKDRSIFLGLELEYIIKKSRTLKFDRPALCSATMKNIADSPFGNHCLMKFDRSIGEGEMQNATGFEIVTVPATLAYHKEMFDKHFFMYCSKTKKWVCRHPIMAATTCGLHVHIGKDAFIPADDVSKIRKNPKGGHLATFRLRIGKFIGFMSSHENLKFISDVAGREPNSYCLPNQVKQKNRFGVHNGIGSAKSIQPNQGYKAFPRRSIVNTENPETIEIRVFDSTTDRNQLFRRLEFCHALVEFVKVCSPRQLTVYHFVSWLCDEKNGKRNYPALLHWLSTRKMVGITKKVQGFNKKVVKRYGPCLLEPPKEPDKSTEGYTSLKTSKIQNNPAEYVLNPLDYVLSDGAIYNSALAIPRRNNSHLLRGSSGSSTTTR
jgi:hypothetical protein